jgi:hypothetical protein
MKINPGFEKTAKCANILFYLSQMRNGHLCDHADSGEILFAQVPKAQSIHFPFWPFRTGSHVLSLDSSFQ